MFYDSTWHDKDGNIRSPYYFLAGIKGFADDVKYKKTNGGINEKANIDDTENIIDFLEYLKRKRKKELH